VQPAPMATPLRHSDVGARVASETQSHWHSVPVPDPKRRAWSSWQVRFHCVSGYEQRVSK